jgi:hypothetical protein
MRKSVGLIILIWAITKIFDSGSVAFENATVASFELVETAAQVSTEQLKVQLP